MTCDASQEIYVPLRKASTAVLALLKILSALFGYTVSGKPSQTVSVDPFDRPSHPTETQTATDSHPETVVEDGPSQLGVYLRLIALFIALTPITLLGVARCLQPSSKGLGTHHQLGLPPCSMRVLVGIRCPGCGMTTSWAHFTRGQWEQSIRVNPGGFLLALFGLGTAVLAFRTAWTGRLPANRTQAYYTYCLVGIATITVLDWCSKLMA